MAAVTRSTAPRLILLALFCLLSRATTALAQEIVVLSTRPGVTQSYFLTSIPKNLQAVAVLFPGSGGLISVRTESGKVRFNQGNFLVRSRAEFVKRGVVAAIIDALSDQQGGWGMSDEFRLGVDHFTDISAVINDLRSRFAELPCLWLELVEARFLRRRWAPVWPKGFGCGSDRDDVSPNA